MDEQQPPYQQQPPQYQPPPQYPPPAPGVGLSDNQAAALAYFTIIPAIIFLVLEPYNRNPFIKFNCFQCIGLVVTIMVLACLMPIPILGWFLAPLCILGVLVLIIICIINAFQGKVFRFP